MSYAEPFFNRIIRLTHMISAQYPVTLSATAWMERVWGQVNVCKCASDSRDVSGIVADAEVLLEVHGFVGGAELEERRRRRCEREASILSHLYFSGGTDELKVEGTRLHFGSPAVEKLSPLVRAKQNCACVELFLVLPLDFKTNLKQKVT